MFELFLHTLAGIFTIAASVCFLKLNAQIVIVSKPMTKDYLIISALFVTFSLSIFYFAEANIWLLIPLCFLMILAVIDFFTSILPLSLQALALVSAILVSVINFNAYDWDLKFYAAFYIASIFIVHFIYTTLRRKPFGIGLGDIIMLPALLLTTPFQDSIDFLIGLGVLGGFIQILSYIMRYNFFFYPVLNSDTTSSATPMAPSLLIGSMLSTFSLTM